MAHALTYSLNGDDDGEDDGEEEEGRGGEKMEEEEEEEFDCDVGDGDESDDPNTT